MADSETMTLYKFRSFNPLDHALDILANQRFYCAPIHMLNDPMEGVFLTAYSSAPSKGEISAPEVSALRPPELVVEHRVGAENAPGNQRVCCFSATREDLRLWSYYADGFRGIAIAVELARRDIVEVDYVPALPKIEYLLGCLPVNEYVLATKLDCWAHEQEYRFLTDEAHLSVPGAISRIYLGGRVSPLNAELVRRCAPANVEIVRTRVDPLRLAVVDADTHAA